MALSQEVLPRATSHHDLLLDRATSHHDLLLPRATSHRDLLLPDSISHHDLHLSPHRLPENRRGTWDSLRE